MDNVTKALNSNSFCISAPSSISLNNNVLYANLIKNELNNQFTKPTANTNEPESKRPFQDDCQKSEGTVLTLDLFVQTVRDNEL